MSKNLFDMGSLLKNAKKIQEEMKKIQEELANEVVEASAGGGMVTVKANGRQEIISIKIDKEISGSLDTQMLEDLVLAAVNEALKKSQDLMQEKMGGISRGMQIPGLF